MAEIHRNTTLTPSKRELLEAWLPRQRWYRGNGRSPQLTPLDSYRLDDPDGEVGIEFVIVLDSAGEEPVVYQVPLTYRGAPSAGLEHALVGTMQHGVLGPRWVYDGTQDAIVSRQLLELLQGRVEAQSSRVSDTVDERVVPTADTAQVLHVATARVLAGEQSNTSVICETVGAGGTPGRPVIIKYFRVLHAGNNPDVELTRALTRAGSRRVPPLVGSVSATLEIGADAAADTSLAVVQEFLPRVEDAWRVALRAAAAGEDFSARARELGAVTGEIHQTLAEALGTRSAVAADRARLTASFDSRLDAALKAAPGLAAHEAAIRATLDLVGIRWPALQRIHGDYHLGQVLHTDGSGWQAVDFEGEPMRPLAERNEPDLALRDVAGMLRSIDYAAASVREDRRPQATAWATDARAAFLTGWRESSGSTGSDDEGRLLQALELDKALYEVAYESHNRPDWIRIPVDGVLRLIGGAPGAAIDTLPADIDRPPQVDDPHAVDAFLGGRHSQPHDLLGHHIGPAGLTITAYRPLATSVRARLADGSVLELSHVRSGVWSVTDPDLTSTQDYRLLVTWDDGIEHEQDDPYRFAPTLGELDRHLINEGRHEQLWTVLGAQVRQYPGPLGQVRGVAFAVWAPRARTVHVVGDFNGWDRISHPMRMLGASGVWELFVPDVGEGTNYQFAIRGQDGSVALHADPLARYAEIAPKHASIVYESHYEWGDQDWMQRRPEQPRHDGPMSVYEVHLGSWRQGLSYADLAEHLVNYVLDLGFTHVEFMPVMEHPFVPSWGYHVTGYYAVSSRWGTPDEFRLLVDYLHRNGIGVILDWVPGHFATDPWALARFDGQPLYEHPDPRRGWHNEWGSYIFDFGRPEVRNFLVANAIYWLEEFHVDGLRVDGVASMLYLDYSRKDGDWIPNVFGGRENLEAVHLLQETNATAYRRVPGIITVAEESTSWPGVTRATSDNGLGFGFKWNMGWMNDSLRYLGLDPIYRQYHQGLLTFALVYAYSENFVLPISHDEVVHGKGSLLRKATGTRDEQLATLRAFLAHMWSHPGKQLIFMGCEFAQESEWADGRSLDWWLLDQPIHFRVHAQVKDMNRIYTANPQFWELDVDPAGFQWLNADDAGNNTISYLRFGRGDRATSAPTLAVVTNLSGSTHDQYRIGLPRAGSWTVVLDTAGYRPEAPSSTGLRFDAQDQPWNGQPFSLAVTVPALSTVWLIPDPTADRVQSADEGADVSADVDAESSAVPTAEESAE